PGPLFPRAPGLVLFLSVAGMSTSPAHNRRHPGILPSLLLEEVAEIANLAVQRREGDGAALELERPRERHAGPAHETVHEPHRLHALAGLRHRGLDDRRHSREIHARQREEAVREA